MCCMKTLFCHKIKAPKYEPRPKNLEACDKKVFPYPTNQPNEFINSKLKL